MSDDLTWRLGARHPGHDYKIFRTHFRDSANPRTGTAMRFSLIEAADWVNVIARTETGEIVMVRQYRPGVDRVCLEIPGGMIDPGEDPIAAARRELAEETGYTGGHAELIGRVAPNPAIQNNTLFTVLVTGVALTASPHLDPGEVIAVHTAPLAEVKRQIRDGELDHALVVVAFAHLVLRAA
jgi:8-oxo-dGTP pyrophosphatase MutT (NUDIX family)